MRPTNRRPLAPSPPLPPAATASAAQNQLRRMRLQFDIIDVDESGSIDAEEFFEMLGEVM